MFKIQTTSNESNPIFNFCEVRPILHYPNSSADSCNRMDGGFDLKCANEIEFNYLLNEVSKIMIYNCPDERFWELSFKKLTHVHITNCPTGFPMVKSTHIQRLAYFNIQEAKEIELGKLLLNNPELTELIIEATNLEHLTYNSYWPGNLSTSKPLIMMNRWSKMLQNEVLRYLKKYQNPFCYK